MERREKIIQRRQSVHSSIKDRAIYDSGMNHQTNEVTGWMEQTNPSQEPQSQDIHPDLPQDYNESDCLQWPKSQMFMPLLVFLLGELPQTRHMARMCSSWLITQLFRSLLWWNLIMMSKSMFPFMNSNPPELSVDQKQGPTAAT